MKTGRSSRTAHSIVLFSALAADALLAQTAPPYGLAAPVSDEVLRLSAFAVTAEGATSDCFANGIGTPIIDTTNTFNVCTGKSLVDTPAFEWRQSMNFVPSVRTNEEFESNLRVRGFSVNSLLRYGHFRRRLLPPWNIDRDEAIQDASAISGRTVSLLTGNPSRGKLHRVSSGHVRDT
jgi:hypothetical protein